MVSTWISSFTFDKNLRRNWNQNIYNFEVVSYQVFILCNPRVGLLIKSKSFFCFNGFFLLKKNWNQTYVIHWDLRGIKSKCFWSWLNSKGWLIKSSHIQPLRFYSPQSSKILFGQITLCCPVARQAIKKS